jgi:hypothetical protein
MIGAKVRPNIDQLRLRSLYPARLFDASRRDVATNEDLV